MLDVYLNGIKLDCETIDDSFSKALAKYELPYRDEALLEDMGQKARTIRLRCYFWRDTYVTHRTLLDLLYNQQSFELIHPEYGLLKGSVETVSVRRDDREQTAEIDLDFVEGVTGVEATIAGDIGYEAEEVYEEGLSEAEDAVTRDMVDTLGAESGEILDQILDPETDILEQFSGLSTTAREYVKKVDEIIRTIEGTLSDVATPANALISTIDFATNLPGRVIGAVAYVASRYSELYDTLDEAPDRFVQSFKDGMAELEESIFSESVRDGTAAGTTTSLTYYSVAAETSLLETYTCVIALEAGLQAGYGFAEDEEKRKLRKKQETLKTFDMSGKYLDPEPLEQVMTVGEIETALYTAREMLQDAVDSGRENQAPKDMALALLHHVNEIKIERDRIVEKNLDNPTPIHLICLRYGMPYRMAERLLSINEHVSQPNFTAHIVKIYM